MLGVSPRFIAGWARLIAEGRAALARNPSFPRVTEWARWRVISPGDSEICLGHSAAWFAAARLRAKHGQATVIPHTQNMWGDSPDVAPHDDVCAIMTLQEWLHRYGSVSPEDVFLGRRKRGVPSRRLREA